MLIFKIFIHFLVKVFIVQCSLKNTLSMHIPLSEQLRPKTLSEVAGQEHLVGPQGWITRIVQTGRPLSILLWGPPGCGKTTIAKLYAQAFKARYIPFSAAVSGSVDLKKMIKEAQDHPLLSAHTIVFVDEIHRFNKAQQDLFLPFLEEGTITLIGATTENPSFALNDALLSRLRVLTLNPLGNPALSFILSRFEEAVKPLPLTPEARDVLLQHAQGDGRHLVNMLENIAHLSQEKEIDQERLAECIQKRAPLYDKQSEGHHNLISALHKSIRGSDPDAALYWLFRMLQGGEDPHFIARRLVRAASEDVGLADPQALQVALNAWQAFERLGAPEGELALAQAAIYLALAPKSNASYVALQKVEEVARNTSHLPPPKIILNAPTRLMKELGYGKGYQYDHDLPEGISGQNYFPEGMAREKFYEPVERGFEREMQKRLAYFSKKRS